MYFKKIKASLKFSLPVSDLAVPKHHQMVCENTAAGSVVFSMPLAR